MPKTIEKKCWPEYFELVARGEKNFDLRLADFEAKKGDMLLLREYDPKKKQYTGREKKKEITYVTNSKKWTVWPQKEIEEKGFIVMELK